MLALKILTYATVCCGFSGYASLEIPLVIQLLTKRECLKKLVRQLLYCLSQHGFVYCSISPFHEIMPSESSVTS